MRVYLALIVSLAGIACVHSIAKPAAYGVELQACTADASTLAASLACENEVRARYARPLLDGGADGSH